MQKGEVSVTGVVLALNVAHIGTKLFDEGKMPGLTSNWSVALAKAYVKSLWLLKMVNAWSST